MCLLKEVLKGSPWAECAGVYIASHQASPGWIYLTNRTVKLSHLKQQELSGTGQFLKPPASSWELREKQAAY